MTDESKNPIQTSDPQLDVLMVEVQERLGRYLQETLIEVCPRIGIAGRVDANTRAASLGESGEIMIVTIIKIFAPPALSQYEEEEP